MIYFQVPFSFLLSLKNKCLRVFGGSPGTLLASLFAWGGSFFLRGSAFAYFVSYTCQSWCGVMFCLPDVWCLWLWNVNLKCWEFSSYPHVPRTTVIKMPSWNVPHYTYPRSWPLLINWRTFFRFLFVFVDCHTTIQDNLNFLEVMHQGTLFVECRGGSSSQLFPSSVTLGAAKKLVW